MGKFIERQMVEKERARKSILGRVRTWRGEELSVSVVAQLTKRNLFAAIKAGHSRQQPPPLYQTICLDLFRCTVLYNGEQ